MFPERKARGLSELQLLLSLPRWFMVRLSAYVNHVYKGHQLRVCNEQQILHTLTSQSLEGVLAIMTLHVDPQVWRFTTLLDCRIPKKWLPKQ